MAARPRPLSRRLIVLLIAGAALLVVIRLLLPATPPGDLFPYHELRIGVDPSRPPFAAFNPDGSVFGMEIDLGNELGARLGLPVRFVPLGYDGLYDALKADQVDALIAGLTIDLTRLENVHYSQPYFNAGLVLVSDKGFVRMEDIPGHSLGYEFGSEADSEARTWLRRVLSFETRPYELQRDALDAARLGEADAALVDAVSARLYLRDHPAWRASMNVVTDNLYAIATQSRRPAISDIVNDVLKAMRDDSTLDAILRRWL
ncbi:MAG: amino acid ABC transporter substrate-binding protein [Anaerolineae bacterium]|nr:amino acid ABC transporter substrate-binding protein [Anaerolineae bacterium]